MKFLNWKKKGSDKEPVVRSMKSRVVRCCIVTLCWVLFCVWVGSWMGLFVIPFIIDAYITKKIPWNWWKKSENPVVRRVMSWVDAIVFALVAVYFVNLYLFQNYVIPSSSLEKSLLTGDYLFVSKVSYGPRKPFTPLHMPLTSHTMPLLGCNSFVEWIQWGYDRVKGLGNVEQGEIVVFNYPAGDTVLANYQNQDYYTMCYETGKVLQAKMEGKNFVEDIMAEEKALPVVEQLKRSKMQYEMAKTYFEQHAAEVGETKSRPVDMREHYVKRCVGMPGQTLQIKNGIVYTDGKKMFQPTNVQYNYIVTLKHPLPDELCHELGISKEDMEEVVSPDGSMVRMPLTPRVRQELLKRQDLVESISASESTVGYMLYPHTYHTGWTANNYGPVWIPKRGATISLTPENIAIYERCISAYEGNTIEQRNGKTFINGQPASKYTFKMDYYWMMGDNRDRSSDSRFWGFVPEDHIVGKPIFIWLSLDPDRGWFDGKIRWSRLFRSVDSMR